jgi:hypothetical protein
MPGKFYMLFSDTTYLGLNFMGKNFLQIFGRNGDSSNRFLGDGLPADKVVDHGRGSQEVEECAR